VGGLEMAISLELAQLALSSTALLAVNRSGWGDLQLQQALKYPMSCAIISNIHRIGI
jgi:hypothetical protein